MNKNGQKIKSGIKHLAHKENEIFSGTVTAVDTQAYTIDVLATIDENDDDGNGIPITATLNAISNNGNGVILIPAMNSDVVIGTVDGQGEYTLIRASVLQKAIITIGNQVFTMDGSTYSMKCADESLFKIINDLISKILALTVTTGTGPSGTPINFADFQSIQTRLKNLLS